ncbi:MAG: DUF6290 family protein [Phycisphaerae bacterium]|nr:DUF6290 family protein [Phycisphaerae bacterium]MDD5239952.1 DUF6290 family protein [Candidatus Nanoarchaeia archaeon]
MTRIDIRLSEQDKQAIEAKAKQFSMSVSDYIRFVAVNAKIRIEVKIGRG